MRGFIRQVVNWFQWLEIIALIVLLLVRFGGLPFGIDAYAVLTGSMEPNLHVGALAYVQKGVDCVSVEETDIIAFDIGNSQVATHRVVENDPEGRMLITKGDANPNVDFAPVSYGSVIGVVVHSIPNLGFVLMAFNDNKVAWLVGIVGLNIALCLVSWLAGNKSFEERKEDGAIR